MKVTEQPYVNDDLKEMYVPSEASATRASKAPQASSKHAILFNRNSAFKSWGKWYWNVNIAISLLIFVLVLSSPIKSASGTVEYGNTLLGALFVSLVYAITLLGPYLLIKYFKRDTTVRKAKRRAELKINKIENDHPARSYRKLIIWLVAIGLIAFIYRPTYQLASLKLYEAHASVDIKDVANGSGLNSYGKYLFYKAGPVLLDADELNNVCPSEDSKSVEFGCYIPSKNKMYLLKVSDSEYKQIEYTTAAHETLHAAWHHLSESDRQDLSSALKEVYDATDTTESSTLHKEIALYNQAEVDTTNELHSFIGAESAMISMKLTQHYSKYFDNRTKSVQASTDFNLKLDSKAAELNAESSSLDTESTTIDDYKTTHLDNADAYLRRAEYYGDIANYNRNVGIYNSNLAIYKNKVRTYNEHIASFNNEVEDYNRVINSFRPTATPKSTR